MGSRNKRLDILRAIAVFMTFGQHMVKPHQGLAPAAYKILRLWEKTGWAGVVLFFVLSGYLVSSLMFNEFSNTGTIRFGRFYIRRGLKIYPAFYVMLACTLLLGYLDAHYFHRDLVPQDKLTGNIILSEALFVQNYFGFIWVHVWSLAVEEHFYISLGLVIFLIMWIYPRMRYGLALRDRFTPLPWFCLIVFVAVLALRCYFIYGGAPRDDDAKFAAARYTHLRIDSLLFGVFLAYFAKFRADAFLEWVQRHTILLLIAGLLLTAPSLKFEETDNFMFAPGFTLMHLGFGCILLFTLFHPWKVTKAGPGPVVRALSYIGQTSYSVYLWHYPVMVIIAKLLPPETHNYYMLVAIQCIAGLIVGLVMARLIEMPVLKLRDKFFTPTKALNAGV